MSDRKFSTHVLGISPAYFCLLKAGKRPVTGNLAVLFLQKLPEVTPAVTVFIMKHGNDHDTHQKGKESQSQNSTGGTLEAQERA